MRANDRRTQGEEEVLELTQLIAQLQVQQRRLERRLTRVQRLLEHDTNDNSDDQKQADGDHRNITQPNRSRQRQTNRRSSTTVRQQSERLYDGTYQPQIGDRVRGINP